jgi:diadenosine tetraphosphate (Ap4A) HIT family hydrolase
MYPTLKEPKIAYLSNIKTFAIVSHQHKHIIYVYSLEKNPTSQKWKMEIQKKKNKDNK